MVTLKNQDHISSVLTLCYQYDTIIYMSYTQLKLKPEYRAKLIKIAKKNKRSMANMVEVLIDDLIEADYKRKGK